MEPATPTGRGWRKLIAAVATAVTICTGAGLASASGGGGIGSPEAPKLTGVICLDKCAGQRIATHGSLVRIDGRNLDHVDEVKFAGGNGRIAVAPGSVSASAIEAQVPDGAVTGTVKAGAYGYKATTPPDKPLEIVGAGQIPDAVAFKLTHAEAVPSKTYYDGLESPTVTYLFQGAPATGVRVEVVDSETKEVVQSFVDEDAVPNAQNVAGWNGRTSDGTVAANGEYKFRIGSVAGGTAETTADARFGFYQHRFPIAARHRYGDGFGAGRNHQGQDVFAKCGTTLRAARGGRVQWNKTHGAAGNYLVIDAKGTGIDHMYAHLATRSPLQKGDRVRTGQRIGQVGDSGNASGCHLHFEIWSAPGWYEGGNALSSVAQTLKLWDTWS